MSKKFNLLIRSFFWILPFLGFTVGYVIVYAKVQRVSVKMPNVMGKKLQEALSLLSSCQLNIRIFREIEDSLLPAGIVLNQIPQPYQYARLQQTVFLTVSKKPKPLKTQDFIGLKEDEVQKMTRKTKLEICPINLESFYPAKNCIAQSPSSGHEVGNNRVIVYFSSGSNALHIIPDFVGQQPSKVQEYLKKWKVDVEIIACEESYEEAMAAAIKKVIVQQPLGGSIVDLNKPFTMQLRVA